MYVKTLFYEKKGWKKTFFVNFPSDKTFKY